MSDGLAERMKLYESAEAGRRLMPLLPALARLDGRAFGSFTRDLARPFDERLSRLMIETCVALVSETCATVGYTQSDEITLAWVPEAFESQIFFDGRVQKMCSGLAALATAQFARRLPTFLPNEFAERVPTFDCRVWNVPTLEEAANVFVWREMDATKNSIAMAARAHYPHVAVQGKSGAEMQELLFQKGVNWNDYPAYFKRGTYVRRVREARPFSSSELGSLPPKHAARANPELVVERTACAPEALPPIVRVENRLGVLFRGEPARERACPVDAMPGGV